MLDEVERFFAAGSGEALLWSPWPTPDLAAAWLAALRATRPCWPARRSTSRRCPRGRRGPTIETGHAPRPASSAWEQAAIDGYPLPELQPASPGSLASPSLLDDDRLAFYIGHAGDGPATARRQCLGLVRLARHRLAGLRRHPAGGAGRGHWHGHAVARLRANPSVWTLGVFSDFSRPLAEHLGFVPLLRFTLWIRDRAQRH